jgi:hypothetical protein
MGQWDKELDRFLKLSQKDKENYEHWTTHYEGIVDSAQAYISGYTKAAPKFAKTLATLMETSEICARAAAELSVYEEEYEAAKKNKDKGEMKKIEGKMKPLIESFENGRKDANAAVAESKKEQERVEKLLDGVRAATA